MMQIHKKIVLDEDNVPLEVIINYDEWGKIEQMLGYKQKVMRRDGFKKYIDILHLDEDPLDFQRRIRSEWR